MKPRMFSVTEHMVQCRVCKTWLPQSRADLWVYHSSFGVVCVHHHGVSEWYRDLLYKASLELAKSLED